MREMEERAKFEKSSFVQKEALKAFMEIMLHEYKLLKLYKPQMIIDEEGKYLDKIKELESGSKIDLDMSKLSKEKGKYLETVAEEFSRNLGIKHLSIYLTETEYAEKQKEKTDMFLFVKIFCPKLYGRYVRL